VADGALVPTRTGADRHVVRYSRLLVDDRRQPMTILAVRLHRANETQHQPVFIPAIFKEGILPPKKNISPKRSRSNLDVFTIQ